MQFSLNLRFGNAAPSVYTINESVVVPNRFALVD